MKKKENIIMGIGVLLLIVSIVGISYAAFSYTGAGSKVNTITTGVISMSYTESDNVISMDKALPTTDETGTTRLRDGEYFDFTVSSTITGSATINYEVAAEALSSNTFDGYNVRLYLTKINGTTEEEVMYPQNFFPLPFVNYKTGRPAGMMSLTTGTIGTSETIKYRLRMYVDEYYDPQDDNGNETFQVRINVYGKVDIEQTGTLIKAYNYQEPQAIDDTDDSPDFHYSSYYYNTLFLVTKDNNEIPETALESWDISEAGDGKAVAYFEESGETDENGNPLYTLTLGGEGGLLANPIMYGYFASFGVYLMDLSYLDTSQVTDMGWMFAGCSNVETLDLSGFDTSKVTNMRDMFHGCSRLYELDLKNFNTSNVIDMADMFYRCRSLTSLDLSNFDTSKVTSMNSMFSGSTKLISITVSSKWVIGSSTFVRDMFYNCGTDHVTYV